MPVRLNRQWLSKTEFVSADGQQKRGRWRLLLDLCKHGQDGTGTHGVGGKGDFRLRLKQTEAQGCLYPDAGIDEEHPVAFTQVQGMLDLQLEIRQQVNAGQPTRRLYLL